MNTSNTNTPSSIRTFELLTALGSIRVETPEDTQSARFLIQQAIIGVVNETRPKVLPNAVKPLVRIIMNEKQKGLLYGFEDRLEWRTQLVFTKDERMMFTIGIQFVDDITVTTDKKHEVLYQYRK